MKKIAIIAAALALVAGPAHAGPVAAVVAWVGKTIAANTLMGLAVRMVVSAGVSLLAQALRKKQSRPESDVQFDIKLGDEHPLTFVVGDCVTAGKRKYLGSWGTQTRFITEVIEVSALPQGLSGLWVDDEPGVFVAGRRGYVSASANPSNVGNISEGATVPGGSLDLGTPLDNYRDNADSTDPRIWVKWIDGTQSAADPLLTWAFGGDPDYPWIAAMIGTGKSYAIVTTQYDHDTLLNYPAYLFQPAPLAVYDPRLDSTNGGSGPQRWANPATWQPSRNPAVISYNIARGIYYGGEWVFGGRNLPAWRLPVAEWIAAANECDAPEPLAGGGSEPAYRCGAEISVDMAAADVLEEIGRAGNMRFAEVGGQLKPIVGLPGAAVFSFTDDDIIITEGQSFRPFVPVSETFNAISATYPEPAEKWATKDSPEYIHTDATADDGGRYLPTSISYPAAPYAKQVQRLQRSMLQDYRRTRIHQFHLSPEAYSLEPGVDMVSWTSQRNGYISKLFVVESVAKTPGMNVLVSLREVDPSDYDWSSDFEMPVVITNPGTTPAAPDPVSGFSATDMILTDADGTGRWVAIGLFWARGIIANGLRWQIRLAGQMEATLVGSTQAVDDGMLTIAEGILPRTAYQVRARLIARRRTKWSDWIDVTTKDVRVTRADLEPEILADLEALEDWLTSGVDELSDELRALADAIQAEQNARLDDVRDVAANWRLTRDRVNALVVEVIELANADHLAREEIRRNIAVQIGDLRASYGEQVTTIIGDNLAVVQRIETLEATSGDLSAEVQRVDQARVDGENAMALSIASLAVGTANQFDAARIWHFDADADGWTGGIWQTGGWLRTTGQILSPAGLGLMAARYSQIRLRVRRSGAITWAGLVWWAAAGQDWSTARRIEIPEPAWLDDIGLITVMVPWTGAVDRVRLEFGTGTADVDWIALGRPAPGASSADLDHLRQTMISADDALARDITQMEARLTSAEGGLDAQAGAISGLETRVTSAEQGIQSQSTALTALDNRVTDAETKTEANAEAIDALQTMVETGGDGSQLIAAEAIRALRSALHNLAAESAEGAARDHLGWRQVREYLAEASQSLNTRIDLTDDQVRIVAEAVTLLQAAMPGLATATALQSLIATVTAQGDMLSVHAQALTSLQAEIADKASASAVQSLGVTVTIHGNTLTAHGQAITALTADLGDKANASALQLLDVKVREQGEDLAASAEALTVLGSSVGRMSAGGRFRVSTEATPTGAQSRIGLRAEASDGAATHSAALYLVAESDGTSTATFAANRFAVVTGSGANAMRRVPFIVRGGNVYMQNAIVDTLSIAENSIIVPVTQTVHARIAGSGSWRLGVSAVTFTLPQAGVVNILWFASQAYIAGRFKRQAIGIRLRIDGNVIWERITGDPPGDGGLETDWLSMGWSHAVSAGSHTITVDWWGGDADLVLDTRTLSVLGAMR